MLGPVKGVEVGEGEEEGDKGEGEVAQKRGHATNLASAYKISVETRLSHYSCTCCFAPFYFELPTQSRCIAFDSFADQRHAMHVRTF